jgi:hypothetical protein
MINITLILETMELPQPIVYSTNSIFLTIRAYNLEGCNNRYSKEPILHLREEIQILHQLPSLIQELSGLLNNSSSIKILGIEKTTRLTLLKTITTMTLMKFLPSMVTSHRMEEILRDLLCEETHLMQLHHQKYCRLTRLLHLHLPPQILSSQIPRQLRQEITAVLQQQQQVVFITKHSRESRVIISLLMTQFLLLLHLESPQTWFLPPTIRLTIITSCQVICYRLR